MNQLAPGAAIRAGLLLTVVASLVVPAMIAGLGNSASAQGVRHFSVDVDGRALQAACVGSGGPTFIQEIGGPDPEGGVASIEEAGAIISNWLGTSACGYDRAGTGQSEFDGEEPRSIEEAGRDLLAVLDSEEMACPCVVMAESLGGGIALAALAQDATNFAGLVLLDSLTPGIPEEVERLAPPGSVESELTPFFAGENEERIDYHMTSAMIPAEVPAIPIAVLTHGAGYPPPCPCSEGFPADEYESIWQEQQVQLAEALGVEVEVAEHTGHVIAGENPQLVVDVVLRVIAETETEAPGTPSPATPTT